MLILPWLRALNTLICADVLLRNYSRAHPLASGDVVLYRASARDID